MYYIKQRNDFCFVLRYFIGSSYFKKKKNKLKDKQIGKWYKKLALVLMTLVSPKKWYSEYDCNCQDKNGQKHYDDQHQVWPARWTILRRRFSNGILKRSPWTRKKKKEKYSSNCFLRGWLNRKRFQWILTKKQGSEKYVNN